MGSVPREQRDQGGAQRARGQIDDAPLRFIHDDGALERLEHFEQPPLQHRQYTASLPE